MIKLEVRDIVMEFPAVRALDGVSIAFESGEVHGIVGENGAGKSTLMKILSGIQSPTSGEVLLDEKPVHLSGVREAQSKGIAMIHQELNLVDELTVAENVFLGREMVKLGMVDRAAMIHQTESTLSLLRVGFSAASKVRDLSIAGKQLVEIAKAVAANASVLIMDEPTAVLSDHEAASLFELIASLKERGVTILYISHRLAEVCDICDRITVLRDGKFIETLLTADASAERLTISMVGRDIGDFFPPKRARETQAPIFEVDCAGCGSLSVGPGEIVGLAGLVGAGRTELCQAVIGERRMDLAVKVQGKSTRFRSPKEALRHGVAYLSEDRKGLGLHVSLDAIENVTLANLRAYGNAVIDHKRERASAESWKGRLNIRAGDLEAALVSVSGGNQQKIAIAKWLETKPKVLILDEPTRGVDVGAKREIYNLIQSLAAEGMACLVISSELLEIIGLCDRAYVMREGRIMGELSGDDLTEQSVMRLAAGVQAA
ncbi:MAG TPA: sugar ABC transporter ATP-binding protein [Fimbriimonas sp.]|nr:sugar ABC transporter ATP-binding protein [Fimbriimonas sp.]